MRIRIVFLFIVCLLICGCHKEEPRNLLSPDEKVLKEVKNFSAYEEVELPTEAPETEQETVAVVVEETETEKIEQPFSKEYDFSENRIIQAFFHNTPYTSVCTQDYNKMERTKSFSTEDETITVTLISDQTSGASAKTLKIQFKDSVSHENIKKLMLNFDNGITEENYERFVNGSYNGSGNAPLIGLADVSYKMESDVTEILLKKAEMPNGPVPQWNEGGADIGILLKSDKFKGTVKNEGDLFAELLYGIDFGKVSMESSKMDYMSVTTDINGKETVSGLSFKSVYHTDAGNNYEIIASFNGEKKDGLTIIAYRKDLLKAADILQVTEHIYQSFYSGEFDKTYSLDKKYKTDHCIITKLEDGFQMRLFG